MKSKTGPLDLQNNVHRRYDPLRAEWVLVSPHRTARPWQGQTEGRTEPAKLTHDPSCYLCPGNSRAGGQINPDYDSCFVFDNDFAALLPHASEGSVEIENLLTARSEVGRCRVMCYSPRHDRSLGDLSTEQLRQMIDVWAAEYSSLGAQPEINAVTIFENRGAMMGASNPHPHCQIWANQSVPDEVLRESESQARYALERNACLLCDYAELELRLGERIVASSEHFVALVPFWAVWPFEILVLPRGHATAIEELIADAREDFARVLKQVVERYDLLFDTPFPYTMGLHQRPTDGRAHPQWHFHAHFYPPLLRSATVRKFMVGYEMIAGPQRDLTPEVAARRLRDAARR